MNNGTAKQLVVPTWFAATLFAALFGGLLSLGGYMVTWNRDDLAFKREVLTRLTQLEGVVRLGVLPRADERISSLERRLEKHIEWAETEERDYDTKINDLERRLNR